MDHVFDLELALTMEDINISGPEIKSSASESGDEEEISVTSTNTTDINICMKMKMMMVIPAAGGGAVCTVCMDGFTGAAAAGGGKQLVSCGHVYHENCITKWLSLHNSCPLCRSSIVSGNRNTTTAAHVIN